MESNFDQTLHKFMRKPCSRTRIPLDRTIMECPKIAFGMRVNAVINRHESIATLRIAHMYLFSLSQSCSDQQASELDTIERRRAELLDAIDTRIRNLSAWSLNNTLRNMPNMMRFSDSNLVNAFSYAFLILLVVLMITKPWEK